MRFHLRRRAHAVAHRSNADEMEMSQLDAPAEEKIRESAMPRREAAQRGAARHCSLAKAGRGRLEPPPSHTHGVWLEVVDVVAAERRVIAVRDPSAAILRWWSRRCLPTRTSARCGCAAAASSRRGGRRSLRVRGGVPARSAPGVFAVGAFEYAKACQSGSSCSPACG
jgi:hypothetical protein